MITEEELNCGRACLELTCRNYLLLFIYSLAFYYGFGTEVTLDRFLIVPVGFAIGFEYLKSFSRFGNENERIYYSVNKKFEELSVGLIFIDLFCTTMDPYAFGFRLLLHFVLMRINSNLDFRSFNGYFHYARCNIANVDEATLDFCRDLDFRQISQERMPGSV